MRAVLSALGIAIGIAAMVAVVGISTSSRAELDQMLSRLGTNLLRVEPGESMMGEEARLPAESVPMVRRIGPVEEAASIGVVPGARAFRSDQVPTFEHGGLSVAAADEELLRTVGASMAAGRWLSAATDGLPVAVLGAQAAEHLGVTRPDSRTVVTVAGQQLSVGGVLDPVELAPEIDSSVLVGKQVATDLLGWQGDPTRIYTRSAESAVDPVRSVIGATANPEAPNEVSVSRPSDALAAKEATDAAFTGLLVGLGAVALLVGGIGVANTMVISVLERRSEIGLRRSLGATRGQVRTQFLVESLLLSLLGGGAGVVIGYGITTVYATSQGWPTSIPLVVLAGGLAATILIGAVAGLYPAIRAARMPPTAALAAS